MTKPYIIHCLLIHPSLDRHLSCPLLYAIRAVELVQGMNICWSSHLSFRGYVHFLVNFLIIGKIVSKGNLREEWFRFGSQFKEMRSNMVRETQSQVQEVAGHPVSSVRKHRSMLAFSFSCYPVWYFHLPAGAAASKDRPAHPLWKHPYTLTLKRIYLAIAHPVECPIENDHDCI